MTDYSNYIERDAFNEALYNLVEEYLQNKDAYPTDTMLAISSSTMEIKLGIQIDFIIGWETYSIQSLLRNNEDNSGIEVDIDATHEIASSHFFVK